MLRSSVPIPSIATAQAREEHERREQQRRLHEHEGLNHRQENALQHAALTAWRRSTASHGRVKLYAPEVVAQLKREEEEKQVAAFDALSPTSQAKLTKGPKSPVSRVVKKFGHVRSASMVDLLFQEVRARAANDSAQLKDKVVRNERAHEQKIDRDFAHIQANNVGFVADIKDYLALATEQQNKRREALYQRWCATVFDPIQRQVAGHLSSQAPALHHFRLALFSHYLHSPTSSLAFPTTCALPNTPASPPPTFPAFRYVPPSTFPPHQSKAMFPAPMWDKLVATPYGRYKGGEGLTEAERAAIEAGVRGEVRRLGWDEYEVGVGSAEAYRQHFREGGVRIVRDGRRKGCAYNPITNV